MSLKINGLDKLQSELGLLQEAVRSDATKVAVRAGANVIKGRMSLDSPILDRITSGSNALPPGTLQGGMTISVRSTRDGVIRAVIGPGRITTQAAHLVEYGHLLVKGGQERITPKGVAWKGGKVGKIIGVVRAHPWLRPAFDTSWRDAIDTYIQTMKEQLKGWVR